MLLLNVKPHLKFKALPMIFLINSIEFSNDIDVEQTLQHKTIHVINI